MLDDKAALSAGQKQLLTIARAMVQDAPILILDEATSALDNSTETEITSALEDLAHSLHGLTLIIIAHRDSSLRFCDRIIDLDTLLNRTL